MGASIPFNTWLVQPGNHRQLQGLRASLQRILARKVEIHSWQDLYWAFEESVLKSEPTRELFKPIFEAYPPSEANGATRTQLMLYRGAKVNPEALHNERSHTVTVTYRGQTIEKTQDSEPQAAEAAEKSDKPARYYRGALIK